MGNKFYVRSLDYCVVGKGVFFFFDFMQCSGSRPHDLSLCLEDLAERLAVLHFHPVAHIDELIPIEAIDRIEEFKSMMFSKFIT